MSVPDGLNKTLTNNNNTNRSKTNKSKQISNTQQTRNRRPQLRSLPNGALEVSHREYVNPIDLRNSRLESRSPITGTLSSNPGTRYSINPGDGGTFPWLSGIATRFEKYEFTRLKFTYHPSVPTTTGGGIALCAIYDPADPLPKDRVALFNAETVTRAAVYDNLDMSFLSKHLKGERHVRALHHGLVDSNELRTSDPGYLVCAIVNATADLQFGDLFVEYTIKLNGPKISKGLAKTAHLQWQVTSTHSASTPVSITDENTLTTVTYPQETHHKSYNTLKTTTQHVGNSGYTIDTDIYYPSRVTFDEPFSGFMVLGHESDGASGLDYSVNEGTVPANAPPRCEVNVIAEGGNISARDQKIYAIEANAGDVLDIGAHDANTASTSWSGVVSALMMEAAPYVVEGLVGLFL